MKRSAKIRIGFLLGFCAVIAGVYAIQKYDFMNELFKGSFSKDQTQIGYENFDTAVAIDKALSEPDGTIITPETMDEVRIIYNGVRMSTVPHVFIDKMPPDWEIKTVQDKTLFMKIITALILRTNEKIINERYVIRLLQEKTLKKIPWNDKEQAFFEKMVQKYDAVLKRNDTGKFLDLLKKIEVIPPSIAVAQAIMFTDWGQKYLKSPYGEYGWLNDKDYEPIAYESLLNATDSFALQLNSRSQLEPFREIRQRIMPYERIQYLSETLVSSLSQYMELDKNYVDKLKATYQSGLIIGLDHACFIGTCTLQQPDPELQFN